jgi:allantoinase
MAKETGCSLHVVHVSTPEGARECASRAAGHDVSCETCPHYLWFTEDDLDAVGARLKCAPPVRDREAVEWLRKYLTTGLITTVGSDHSPAPAALKASEDAFGVWGGIAGVQSTLPVMLTAARHCGLHVIGG